MVLRAFESWVRVQEMAAIPQAVGGSALVHWAEVILPALRGSVQVLRMGVIPQAVGG